MINKVIYKAISFDEGKSGKAVKVVRLTIIEESTNCIIAKAEDGSIYKFSRLYNKGESSNINHNPEDAINDFLDILEHERKSHNKRLGELEKLRSATIECARDFIRKKETIKFHG